MDDERIDALGFLEVRGLAAAIEAADAMVKAASVRLLRQLLRDPAQITLVVEGQLAACDAAVDAGRSAATRLDAFVAGHVMGRPAEDTADFVLVLAEAGRAPFGAGPATVTEPSPAAAAKSPDAVPATIDDAALLAIVAGFPGSCGLEILLRRVGGDADSLRARLDALCADGRLTKKRGRYLAVKPDGDGK